MDLGWGLQGVVLALGALQPCGLWSTPGLWSRLLPAVPGGAQGEDLPAVAQLQVAELGRPPRLCAARPASSQSQDISSGLLCLCRLVPPLRLLTCSWGRVDLGRLGPAAPSARCWG